LGTAAPSFGNVVTSLSWFGVNMLGVGLHSYGFMDGAFEVLAGFILSQLVLVGLSLLPRRRAALTPRTVATAKLRDLALAAARSAKQRS